MSEPQLSVTDLHVSYGPIKALRGVTLHAHEGETIAVLGANGAGKTTLLRAISNMLARQRGAVRVNGADTSGVRPTGWCARACCMCPRAVEPSGASRSSKICASPMTCAPPLNPSRRRLKWFSPVFPA